MGIPAGVSLDLQPLVARPSDVRHFSQERRAGIADTTPTGRLRLDAIARWVQDVAWADVEDAGLRELTLWLVRRTRVRVRRFPRIGEAYRLTTYVTGIGRMWAERRTDLVAVGAETPDVEVACIWVHLDPERLLPSPVAAVELDTWCGPSTRPVKARLRHPAPPSLAPGPTERAWTFRAAELDIADHVNNAAYFTPFDEELLQDGRAATPDPASVDLELEYRAGSQAGAKRVLAAASGRWILDAGTGELHASAVLADWPT